MRGNNIKIVQKLFLELKVKHGIHSNHIIYIPKYLRE